MERRRGTGTVKVAQVITSCYIYQNPTEKKDHGADAVSHLKQPLCRFKRRWYIQEQKLWIHPITPLHSTCRVRLQLLHTPRDSTNSILDCTLRRMLPDVHNFSQNVSLAIVTSNFALDDVNVPCCSYRSLLCLTLTEQIRIHCNTVWNGCDLNDLFKWVLLRNRMNLIQSGELHTEWVQIFA